MLTALQKGKGPKGKGSGNRDDPAWSRTDVIEREHMHNDRLEKYYKAQNILPEQEWHQFLEAMRDPLPTTFRVAGSRQRVAPIVRFRLMLIGFSSQGCETFKRHH